MKRLIAVLLTLVIAAGIIIVPVASSAATVNDCYDFFTTLPESYLYTNDIKKLMKVVPCDDSQAATVLEGLKTLKSISERFKGDSSWYHTDPRGYSKADIKGAIGALNKICDALNVTYEIKIKDMSRRLWDWDEWEVYFSYQGKVIYVYDGDFIKKTGEDVSVLPLVAGSVVLAAAVAFVLVETKKKHSEV